MVNVKDFQLSKDEIQNLTLLEIEKHLQQNKRTLKDYPPTSNPKGYIISQLRNRLIYKERNYNQASQLQQFHQFYGSLIGNLCKTYEIN